MLVAGCDGQGASPPATPDSSTLPEEKTTGHFSCSAFHLDNHLLYFSSSADVAPGKSKAVTVEVPPGAKVRPEQIDAHCQVEEVMCAGSSCGGQPPVDFITPQGDGLSWQSVRTGDGDTKLTFTAVAHNMSKTDTHHITLSIGLPRGAVQLGSP